MATMLVYGDFFLEPEGWPGPTKSWAAFLAHSLNCKKTLNMLNLWLNLISIKFESYCPFSIEKFMTGLLPVGCLYQIKSKAKEIRMHKHKPVNSFKQLEISSLVP